MSTTNCIELLGVLLAMIALINVNSSRISHTGTDGTVTNMKIARDDQSEHWDYVTVRPKAHMFYWLYPTTHPSGYKNRPLVLWLQGGPGASSTGFGNFEEIGPLMVDLKPRNTTWLETASLLFVDNPVGTGFSYVEDASAFVTTNDEIAADMLALLKSFFKAFTQFSEVPFYIFSESYGGKMTASISSYLYEAVQKGAIKLNFKGLAMGDSWISPADSVLSWGPYLFATSIVSKSGLEKINAGAKTVTQLIKEGQFKKATAAWADLEDTVEDEGSGVNFYNIMHWTETVLEQNRKRAISDHKNAIERLFQRHVQSLVTDDLDELMNGPIRKKLGIIPKDVKWGGQKNDVFVKLAPDFMRNVTDVVNDLINNTPLKVVVYNGQLDLIVDVLGTEAWFYRLDVADKFKTSEMNAYSCSSSSPVCFFGKKYQNVEFYWILNSGHMVPADNGPAALLMLNQIIGK